MVSVETLQQKKHFKLTSDGIESCTQSLLIKEKKKVKNQQKELEAKSERCEKLEKQMEQETKKIEALTKQQQKLKEENLILIQQIDFKHNEYEKQLDLIKELKKVLTITIKDHLDEQDAMSTNNNNHHELTYRDEYIKRQKAHLNQLQIVQKLVECLSVAIETVKNTSDTSKFDKSKFQENLNEKLQKLEQEQEQQSKRLSSSVSSPIQSPKFCSLESNCSLITKSPKHLSTEPSQSKFTLNEIRNILLERNSLQSQVKFLEKQLFSFKKFQPSKKDEDSNEKRIEKANSLQTTAKKDSFSTENFKHLAESAKKDKHKSTNSETKRQLLSSPEPDFLPVEGPINREPDEKLFPFKRRISNSPFLKFFPFPKINRNK